MLSLSIRKLVAESSVVYLFCFINFMLDQPERRTINHVVFSGLLTLKPVIKNDTATMFNYVTIQFTNPMNSLRSTDFFFGCFCIGGTEKQIDG